MDIIRNNFASQLKNARKANKLSQGDLASLANVSQSIIARYESAQVEATISSLINISKALNVTTDFLLGVKPVETKEVAPEFNQEQLQVVELIKKLNSKELEKVYNYLLGIIDARN